MRTRRSRPAAISRRPATGAATASASCRLAREAIALAPYRQDAGRLGWIGLDLGAQPVDVGVDRMLIAVVLIAPHLVEQIQSREYFCGILDEKVQQVELARRQIQRAAFEVGLARQRIETHAVQLQRAALVV